MLAHPTTGTESSFVEIENEDTLRFEVGPAGGYATLLQLRIVGTLDSTAEKEFFLFSDITLDTGEVVQTSRGRSIWTEASTAHVSQGRAMLFLERDPPVAWPELTELDGVSASLCIRVEDESGASTHTVFRRIVLSVA